MLRTLESQISPTDSGGIPFAVYANPATPTSSTSLDTASFSQVGVAPVLASALSPGTAVTVQLQHSDSASSGFEDVPGASQALNGSQDSQALGFHRTRGLKRYVRLTATVTGANASFGAILYGLAPRMQEDEGSPAYSL